jgi:hypothetical protein
MSAPIPPIPLPAASAQDPGGFPLRCEDALRLYADAKRKVAIVYHRTLLRGSAGRRKNERQVLGVYRDLKRTSSWTLPVGMLARDTLGGWRLPEHRPSLCRVRDRATEWLVDGGGHGVVFVVALASQQFGRLAVRSLNHAYAPLPAEEWTELRDFFGPNVVFTTLLAPRLSGEQLQARVGLWNELHGVAGGRRHDPITEDHQLVLSILRELGSRDREVRVGRARVPRWEHSYTSAGLLLYRYSATGRRGLPLLTPRQARSKVIWLVNRPIPAAFCRVIGAPTGAIWRECHNPGRAYERFMRLFQLS